MRKLAILVTGVVLAVVPMAHGQRLFDTFVPRPNIVDRPFSTPNFGKAMQRQSTNFFNLPSLKMPTFNLQNAIHRFTFRYPFQNQPRSTADLQTFQLPVRSQSPF